MSYREIISETFDQIEIVRANPTPESLMIKKGLLLVLGLVLIILAGKFLTFYFHFPLIYCIFLQRYEITIRFFYVRIMSF